MYPLERLPGAKGHTFGQDSSEFPDLADLNLERVPHKLLTYSRLAHLGATHRIVSIFIANTHFQIKRDLV